MFLAISAGSSANTFPVVGLVGLAGFPIASDIFLLTSFSLSAVCPISKIGLSKTKVKIPGTVFGALGT